LKRILVSYFIGFAVIAFLWSFAMYGARHQERETLSNIAYVIAGIIDIPVMALYGMDGRGAPLLISIAIYLAEAGILSLFVYLIFFARPK
jgi:hypothetical protein